MTTTTVKASGFIVAEGFDGSLIWGVGATEKAAIADAKKQAAYSGKKLAVAGCVILPATAKLICAVRRGDGALEWAVWAGVAQTFAESVRR
jgi:hypothetical protein